MAIQRIKLDILMIDGTEHIGVVVTTADRMKLAEVARRHKWGTLEDDPDRSVTFLAWHALARTGAFSGTFDDFVAQSETVAGDQPDTVDPTRPVTPAT